MKDTEKHTDIYIDILYAFSMAKMSPYDTQTHQ